MAASSNVDGGGDVETEVTNPLSRTMSTSQMTEMALNDVDLVPDDSELKKLLAEVEATPDGRKAADLDLKEDPAWLLWIEDRLDAFLDGPYKDWSDRVTESQGYQTWLKWRYVTISFVCGSLFVVLAATEHFKDAQGNHHGGAVIFLSSLLPPCIGYGLANKHQSSKQQGCLFLNEQEARSVSSRVMPYGRGFLAMKTGKERLEEGYLPVARLVLDNARRKMYRLHKALEPLGPVAVRTDCVYVPADRAEEIPAALKAAGLEMVDRGSVFHNIGRFRLEKPKSADMLPTKCDCEVFPVNSGSA